MKPKMARRKNGRKSARAASPRKGGAVSGEASSGALPADESPVQSGNMAEVQSPADAWLAIKVDESAIGTLDESDEEDPRSPAVEESSWADVEHGAAATSSLNTKIASPSPFEFPSEADFGQSIAASGDAALDYLDLLSFGLTKETFAIDIRDVKEIIRVRPVTELPGVPDFITGIISLRGKILPVVDLRLRLGFPAPEEQLPMARIIVVALEDRTAGILVDEVMQKVRLQKSKMSPAPAVLGSAEAGFLLGVCRDQERLISVLNPESVLAFGPFATAHATEAQSAGERA